MCLYGPLLLWIVSILYSSTASKSKEVCIAVHDGKFFPYVQVTFKSIQLPFTIIQQLLLNIYKLTQCAK